MTGDGDARRDALVDAALGVLAARGEAGVTLTEVARHAGVSKALVLYHFGTRKRLLDAVAERLLAETNAGLARLEADYPVPRERVDALLDALFEEPPELDREGVRNVLAFWLAPDRHAVRARAIRHLLEDALHAAAGRLGGARGTRNRERAAALVVNGWMGALVQWASGVDVDFELARRDAGERVDAAISATGR